jgi:hypothetical protein
MRARLLVYGGPIALLIGVSAYLYVWANQPVTVSPRVEGAKTTTPEQGSSSALMSIGGSYYKVSIDSGFRIAQQQSSRVGTVLESLFATETTRGSGHLAISVEETPAGGISEVSGVVFRLQNPNIYTPVQLPNMPTGALAFRATNQYEVDVFLPHGEQYASLVLSNSMGGPTTYDDDFTAILASWKWLR